MHPDHKEFFAALGRRIKELRKENGWSLRDMVIKHGYYDAQWRKYENGGPVTVDSMLRMATMFGLSLVQLLDGLGEFPRRSAPEIEEKAGTKRKASDPASKNVGRKVSPRADIAVGSSSRRRAISPRPA